MISGTETTMPEGFPLAPLDRRGKKLAVGDSVIVLDVELCAHDLPEEDQARLRDIVGRCRTIVKFDSYGFIWLSFSSEATAADFSLFPKDVALE